MQVLESYTELITHYINKLSQLEEDLDMAKRNLETYQFQIEDSWKSDSADALNDKIEDFKKQIRNENNNFEEAINFLVATRSLIETDIVSLLEQ